MRSAKHGRYARILYDYGLTLVLLGLFAVSMVGQTTTGWRVYNQEQREHGEAPVSLQTYLRTGHFGEATFENWESEFLQMAFYVLLTAFLYQKGAAESKRPGVREAVDLDPRESPDKAAAPWPVRQGGAILILYENSLSLAFAALFLASFALHVATGVREFNQTQVAHGQNLVTPFEYLVSAQFWFESFQNWQSEFLSLASVFIARNRAER